MKVTDFGIAKARGALDARAPEDTQSKQLHGKFAYMSPEQARGDAVDARSDLFSLGIVLYECIAGVNPFSGPTTFETMRRVQACEYPPIEILRSDTPAELIALVKQALAREPDARFADAGRMYEALLAFLYSHGRRYSASRPRRVPRRLPDGRRAGHDGAHRGPDPRRGWRDGDADAGRVAARAHRRPARQERVGSEAGPPRQGRGGW